MKKLLFFIGILIALFIINGMVQSIISLSQKNSVMERARRELQEQKTQNSKLKEQLAEVKDTSFIEKEARNKLFLVKSGEEVILIPSPSVTPMVSPTAKKKRHQEHWQEWLAFFMHTEDRY